MLIGRNDTKTLASSTIGQSLFCFHLDASHPAIAARFGACASYFTTDPERHDHQRGVEPATRGALLSLGRPPREVRTVGRCGSALPRRLRMAAYGPHLQALVALR